MLLLLSVFWTPGFCLSSGVRQQTALLNSTVTLPCPHATGDITWSRALNGVKVSLVTIKNGEEKRNGNRYGSLANGALVITKVQTSDETMYLCNGEHTVYLKVTTDPNKVSPKGQPEDESAAAPGGDSVNVDLRPDQTDPAPEIQQPSDWWKIPVGLVSGASLVLLVFLILRPCLAKKAKRRSSSERPISEVVYEEIKDTSEQPWGDSEVESPYYWSAIVEAPNTTAPAIQNLYSTVNKLRAGGPSHQDCVYFLAQNQDLLMENRPTSSEPTTA